LDRIKKRDLWIELNLLSERANDKRIVDPVEQAAAGFQNVQFSTNRNPVKAWEVHPKDGYELGIVLSLIWRRQIANRRPRSVNPRNKSI
jgi:hypothetical protein